MKKIVIVDDAGSIVRSLSLPYEGVLYHLEDITDAEFDEAMKNPAGHIVETISGKPKLKKRP